MTDGDSQIDRYIVLINAEEQYSLWPAAKSIPSGWAETGHEGDKASCMTYVDNHWTDMRPKSLRLAQSQ